MQKTKLFVVFCFLVVSVAASVPVHADTRSDRLKRKVKPAVKVVAPAPASSVVGIPSASAAIACVIRSQVNSSSCGAGEFRMAGGCSKGMDGCYPFTNGWAASGPYKGVGTASVICCTKVNTLNLNSIVQRSFAMVGTSGRVNCAAGEVALSGGGYCGSGWPLSCIPDDTGVSCTTGNVCNGQIHAVCVQTPPSTTVLSRISGLGTATCPVGTTLIGGGWGGMQLGNSAAFPSGNSMTSSGLASAVCAK